tara:strand:- start:3070 stop:3219 length:150 start_codon:yes stop_codon:yes gene_type:complete
MLDVTVTTSMAMLSMSPRPADFVAFVARAGVGTDCAEEVLDTHPTPDCV